jgi:predicted transcriptional regulator
LLSRKGVVGIRNDELAHLPHFESIIVRILEKKGSTCASELAREMFPDHTNSEIRPRISQISVSLKRLQEKGIVKGEKYGRKNFFKVLS